MQAASPKHSRPVSRHGLADVGAKGQAVGLAAVREAPGRQRGGEGRLLAAAGHVGDAGAAHE